MFDWHRIGDWGKLLEIRYNEKFWRHIVAKCDIPVGKTILVGEYFVLSTFEHDRARCFTCLQVRMNFIACSNCTDALFCNEDCHTKNEINTDSLTTSERQNPLFNKWNFICQCNKCLSNGNSLNNRIISFLSNLNSFHFSLCVYNLK